MKSVLKFLTLFIVVITVYLFGNPQPVKADEGGNVCKWKQIDCPGWFTGDYEACLTIGDGNTCQCGTVSRDCGQNTN